MRDNVTKVLSIFEKLIARLEKIIQRERESAGKQLVKMNEAQRKRDEHLTEVGNAENAIRKFKKFLDD